LESDLLVAHQNDSDDEDRPGSGSSTFSNPASRHMDCCYLEPVALADETVLARGPSQDRRPGNRRVLGKGIATVLSDHEDRHEPCCAGCKREAGTYLVELINHPDLQRGRDRAAALASRQYDAVLLVYDVGSRASFEAVSELAAEVSLHRPRGGERRRTGLRRMSVEGLKRGVTGHRGCGRDEWDRGRLRLRRRRSVALGVDAGAKRVDSSMGYRVGGGYATTGPVVALVGNKADFDAEYADVDLTAEEAKRAALEEVGVEERGLVHPLYRVSQVYGDVGRRADTGVAVGLPEVRAMIMRPRAEKKDTTGSSIRPLLSPRSGMSFASDVADTASEWPLTRTAVEGVSLDVRDDGTGRFKHNSAARILSNPSNLDAVIRRSAVSADYHLLSANRASVLSKRSVRTMQEGSKPLVLTKLPRSEAVENWIRTGSPTTGEYLPEEVGSSDKSEVEAEEVNGRSRSYSTTTTAALPRREVSRMEGEMLAQTLMTDVPFFETSAKAGQNVEEMFESLVRQVLESRGMDITGEEVAYAQCWRRDRKQTCQKEANATAARNSKTFVGSAVRLSEDGVEDGRNQLLVSEMQEPDGTYTEFVDVQRVRQRQRRRSMLDRFKKVFGMRPAVTMEDGAG
jgi:hypothetical protein